VTLARRLAAVTLAVTCCVAAGCGGTGGGERSSYTDAITVSLERQPGFAMSTKQTRCFVGKLIDRITIAKLKAAKITPDSAGKDDEILPHLEALIPGGARATTDVLAASGCFDLAAYVREQLGSSFTTTQKQCISDGIDGTPSLRLILIDSVLHKPGSQPVGSAEQLQSILSKCGVKT
jgi:hypothetical protein